MESSVKEKQPPIRDEIDFQSKVSVEIGRVLLKKSVGSVINERTILEQLTNPFIINMISAFQDR